MPVNGAFYAQIIGSSAGSIGAHAAQLLLDRVEEAKGFDAEPFGAWKSHFEGRAQELAAALRAGEPSVFAARLAWARIAWEVRGLADDMLRDSIDALADALSEALPDGSAEATAPYLDAARSALEGETPSRPAPISADTDAGRLASSYLLALLEGDRRRALAMIGDALDKGAKASDVLLDVLMAAEREAGRMWHHGEVTVGEEHLITGTTSLALGLVQHRMEAPSPNGKTVIVGSLLGNQHELAVRVAGLLLESEGWRVIDLGAETPAEDIVRIANDHSADLVVVSAMLVTQLDAVSALARALSGGQVGSGVPLLVGGHAFDDSPNLWRTIGAAGLAPTFEDLSGEAARLVGLAS